MQHLWVPNIFVYNLASFEALNCLEKLAGLWIVDHKNLFYNQVKYLLLLHAYLYKKSDVNISPSAGPLTLVVSKNPCTGRDDLEVI